ncbi:hypothetical protein G9F72_001225 [Clostridium estertheticum]|uniref:hypothetical protein n=1 Tax=Clostridium estertheticum TaxID=238834 RepID=UPI0013E99115|nr:hypothetical protein [Clostridium estertheticum]MBZ9684981.1 hypothetical protein [Clostridium estertheticum]
MPDNKINPTQLSFLKEIQPNIINENLNYSNIIKLSKNREIKVKGLTNDKIRAFLEESEIEYDDVSKRWVNSVVAQETQILGTSGLTSINNEDPLTLIQLNEVVKNPPELNVPDDELKSLQYNNHISELAERILKQELLSAEILQSLVGLTPEINTKTEETLRTYTPDTSTIVQEVLKLTSSKSKRYDLTLSEDLVNKAIEKLKDKHNLEAVEQIKDSKIFQDILFDYIYSSI